MLMLMLMVMVMVMVIVMIGNMGARRRGGSARVRRRRRSSCQGLIRQLRRDDSRLIIAHGNLPAHP